MCIGVWVGIKHATFLTNCVLHSPVISGCCLPNFFQFFVNVPVVQMKLISTSVSTDNMNCYWMTWHKQHLQKDLTISRENPISHLLSPIINSNWRCFCLTTARRLLISPSYCSLSLLISVSFSRSLFGFGWITKQVISWSQRVSIWIVWLSS